MEVDGHKNETLTADSFSENEEVETARGLRGRAAVMQTYLGTVLKCRERGFQGNSAGHRVSSVEEAENDLITKRWENYERALW